MKKSNIIAFIVIIIILVAGVGFWRWKSVKNAEVLRDNQVQQVAQDEQQINNQQPQQLSEDQLVWYEIPELGIKLKVTPDAKEDLKYSIVTNKEGLSDDLQSTSAVLYLKSVVDFRGEKICKSADTGSMYLCSEFMITRLPRGYCESRFKNGGPDNCAIILSNEKYEFNLDRNQQAPRFSSEEDGRKYAENIIQKQNKNLGFFQHYGDMELSKKAYYPFSNVVFIDSK